MGEPEQGQRGPGVEPSAGLTELWQPGPKAGEGCPIQTQLPHLSHDYSETRSSTP